jgi:hypothetical protein
MAEMYPAGVETFETEGEERVYRFLAAVAKPDHEYTVWYTPDIDGREPDFVLLSDRVGLLVLEVKDWALSQIAKANPQRFELKMGGRTETRRNPLDQAKRYSRLLRQRIRKDHRLLSTDPLHRGKLKIPVGYGVVFANITRSDYLEKELDTVCPADRALFWDDLDGSSCGHPDTTGRAFTELLCGRFAPLFPCRLGAQDRYVLKGLLFREVVLEIPKRGEAAIDSEKVRERLRVLDNNQESIARKLGAGHRIVVGPSGSGKTLILAHRAALLRKYDRRIKRILFVCYNITLVNYIRRLLSAKRVPLGEVGVDVLHFFELCAKVLGEPVQYEGEEAAYYDLVIQEAGARSAASALRYDAVLVDEGQDFSDDMMKVVTGLLNPATGNLTIAMDSAQNVYRRSTSWKQAGVTARGRVHVLRHVYRNTREIARFAERFAQRAPTELPGELRQLELLPDLLAMHGPQPRLIRVEGVTAAIRLLPGVIHELQKVHGYPLSEFAVLYPTRFLEGKVAVSLPEAVQEGLNGEGIVHRWASEDYRAKRSYDITTDSVTVSTVHSAKGLDFACVFLVGLDLMAPGRWTEEQLVSLGYVAITRARHHLYVPWCERNLIVERMLGALPR